MWPYVVLTTLLTISVHVEAQTQGIVRNLLTKSSSLLRTSPAAVEPLVMSPVSGPSMQGLMWMSSNESIASVATTSTTATSATSPVTPTFKAAANLTEATTVPSVAVAGEAGKSAPVPTGKSLSEMPLPNASHNSVSGPRPSSSPASLPSRTSRTTPLSLAQFEKMQQLKLENLNSGNIFKRRSNGSNTGEKSKKGQAKSGKKAKNGGNAAKPEFDSTLTEFIFGRAFHYANQSARWWCHINVIARVKLLVKQFAERLDALLVRRMFQLGRFLNDTRSGLMVKKFAKALRTGLSIKEFIELMREFVNEKSGGKKNSQNSTDASSAGISSLWLFRDMSLELVCSRRSMFLQNNPKLALLQILKKTFLEQAYNSMMEHVAMKAQHPELILALGFSTYDANGSAAVAQLTAFFVSWDMTRYLFARSFSTFATRFLQKRKLWRLSGGLAAGTMDAYPSAAEIDQHRRQAAAAAAVVAKLKPKPKSRPASRANSVRRKLTKMRLGGFSRGAPAHDEMLPAHPKIDSSITPQKGQSTTTATSLINQDSNKRQKRSLPQENKPDGKTNAKQQPTTKNDVEQKQQVKQQQGPFKLHPSASIMDRSKMMMSQAMAPSMAFTMMEKMRAALRSPFPADKDQDHAKPEADDEKEYTLISLMNSLRSGPSESAVFQLLEGEWNKIDIVARLNSNAPGTAADLQAEEEELSDVIRKLPPTYDEVQLMANEPPSWVDDTGTRAAWAGVRHELNALSDDMLTNTVSEEGADPELVKLVSFQLDEYEY